MGLFSKKTTEVKKDTKKAGKEVVVATKVSSGADAPVRKDYLQGVILRPRITEKATILSEKNNVYVFEVNTKATKPLVEKAIRALYSVSPEKVTMVRNPAKSVVVRGKPGMKGGVKKAYVFLKKGEKIEFA